MISSAHGIYLPVLMSFPLCLKMLLPFRNRKVSLARLVHLKCLILCPFKKRYCDFSAILYKCKWPTCPLTATSELSRYHSALLHTHEHNWPTYARFRPSNRRIIEGMICAAHSLTAKGRAVEEFRSVHRPSTHSFLSWRLNTNNSFALSTP